MWRLRIHQIHPMRGHDFAWSWAWALFWDQSGLTNEDKKAELPHIPSSSVSSPLTLSIHGQGCIIMWGGASLERSEERIEIYRDLIESVPAELRQLYLISPMTWDRAQGGSLLCLPVSEVRVVNHFRSRSEKTGT